MKLKNMDKMMKIIEIKNNLNKTQKSSIVHFLSKNKKVKILISINQELRRGIRVKMMTVKVPIMLSIDKNLEILLIKFENLI